MHTQSPLIPVSGALRLLGARASYSDGGLHAER